MAFREHPAASGRVRSRARLRGAGNCVVAKISQFTAVLADRSASERKREIALKFLVHLVGDVHQPLHSTDHGDRGGNETSCPLSRKPEQSAPCLG